MSLDPARVIRELRELYELTSDSRGAQRVAWTPTWQAGRDWYAAKLRELPVTLETDEAGNSWATLRGRSETALAMGSHLDTVAGGGWLDGSLGMMASLEVLRRVVEDTGGVPPITIRVVDWADEEGGRFGRSLLGSSACAGTLDIDEIRERVDADGVLLADAMREFGVSLESVKDSHAQLRSLEAYFELHIEQGPVLKASGRSLAAVTGTCGAIRLSVAFNGIAGHPAATPMEFRHDALLGASQYIVGAHEVARRHGGICSIGYCVPQPNKLTVLAGKCEVVVEFNHFDGPTLARIEEESGRLAAEIAQRLRLRVEFDDLWRIETLEFNPDLVATADDVVLELTGGRNRMPSGPLHDAGEMVRAGVPVGMIFVQSLEGGSHCPEEDTRPEDLMLAVRALDRLVERTMRSLARRAG